MSKNLTEQEVLRKLKIDDFSQMTVKQFFELTSMKNVDPEIIKKAIEQIPEFAELIREMINHQKETVEKAMKSNDESMKNCFDAWNRAINILEKELENENLSFDERMEIIEKIMECNKMIDQKDSENKAFLADVVKKVVGGVFMTVAVVLALPIALTMMGGEDNEDTQN